MIAEALRLYADSFWRVLPIGLPIAVTNQVTAGRAFWVQVVALAAATPLLTAAYIAACLVVVKERPPGRVIAIAFAAGVLVVLPVPLLVLVYILPAVAWLAFVGLVVPVVVVYTSPVSVHAWLSFIRSSSWRRRWVFSVSASGAGNASVRRDPAVL